MKIYTRITCDSRNSHRLLNKFLELKINLNNVQNKGDRMSFSVEDKYLKRAVEIMDKMAIGYEVDKRGGAHLLKTLTLRYLSLLIPAIIMLICLIMLTEVCFGVKIACDDPIVKKQITQVLQDGSIKSFTLKSKIDTSKLSYELSKNIDEIGFANCYFDGAVLKIEVKKVHVKEQTESYDVIVADRDCIITKVLVYSGTAVVKAGDVVKKGDTLIAGYVDTMPNDTANEENERFTVKADGMVLGEAAYTKQLVLTADVISPIRTGESFTVTDIYLFGKRIGKQKPIGYGQFEFTQEIKTFGSVIPIKAVSTTYYEVEMRQVSIDEAAIEEEISHAYVELWQSLPQDGKFLNNYIYKKKVDNLHIIDIYLITEENVGEGR